MSGLRTAVRSGRAAANRRLIDTLLVEKPGARITNDDGSAETQFSELYSGPGAIRSPEQGATASRMDEVALMAITTDGRVAVFPSGAFDATLGLRITVLASLFEPDLVGHVYTVVGVGAKSVMTSLRVAVREVARPSVPSEDDESGESS